MGDIERMLPLYQGMMTSFYDHRAADVVRSLTASQRQNQPNYLSDAEKSDPTRLVIPIAWIRESLLPKEISNWMIGFSKLTSATNERTLAPSAIPRSGVADSFPLILTANDLSHCLLACLCSFAVDFIARTKVGGTNLNFYLIYQFPVLPPSYFQRLCDWDNAQTVSAWIAPRVAELVATSTDMVPAAEAMEVQGAPFPWNPVRREILRAELDAAFFHLYGIPRDDVDYIMDTFPIVRRRDEAEHGEFRTKRLILENYDAMALAMRTGRSFESSLNLADSK